MIDLSKLKALIHGDVDASADALEFASHDASIFEIKPEVVVRPKNVEDVKNLVKFATEYQGVHLTARSGGTDMSGGPLTTSIVVDFLKYFDQIKKISDGYAVTQPGVYYRDFDRATLEGGYIMPSYPASREICTVGGMVANNSGGEKTLTYGKTERYIRRLKMVCADGNEYEFKPLSKKELEAKKKIIGFEGDLYRNMDELISSNAEIIEKARPQVSKNSCGYYLWNVSGSAELGAMSYEKGEIQDGSDSYLIPHTSYFDLTKLIVGSQGTLGLITEIEFALVKPKKHSRLLVIFLKDLKQLAETAEHVLKFKPESFESFDDHTFKIAVKFLPQLIRQMGGNIFKFGLSFIPEVFAVLTGGVPKLILMAEFTAETPEEAVKMAEEAKASLRDLHEKSRVTRTEDDAHKYWTMRRESFNMLRHHVKDLRTAPFIDDFAVLPVKLPEFLPRLYTILDQYKLTYTIAGHIGDGNFHIIPLMNLHEQHSHDVIKELSIKVYELVHEFGGTITAEHNDGLIRTPFVKMQFGEEVYTLFERVKKIWDPHGIFNPGKKVGTTWDQAVGRIVK
ncbi:MAG: FAD-binding oxidoreductase [Candidatus Pacebacteria bacterium]|nr:FAD-binding oxidoreductase [Candidatus Paceibacterota bacterium]